MFSMLGFKTIAVEPLPVDGVRVLCQYDGITLIEACLSDVNGTKTIHLGNVAAGLDSNYASLESDWFGVSTETREVQSLTLSKLLLNINAQKVTCLKLDIEGAESTVITKLGELPKAWLPSVVMFEYGGGDSKEKGQYGWSPKYVSATMECIRALKDCGYNCSIMIDNAFDTEARIFELQSSTLEPDSIFYPNGGYGNIIAFRDFNIGQDEVAKVCAPYYEKSPPSEGSGGHENVITISTAEELELYKFQLYQTKEELDQYKDLLNQTQGELQEYQSQLHQTQEVLEQFQDQMQQAETLLQEYQGQLHSTQTELEQSQSQLHSTQTELEQSQSQLHSTQAELEQSQSQLHSTQAVLEQSQSQLRSTEAVLEQSQSQLHQNRAELAHKNSQLHQSEWELERSRFQLHQTQAELAQSQAELAQCNSKVEHIQLEAERLGSQIGQVQGELEHSQSKLRSSSMELKRSHSQLVQVLGELEQSQAQQRQTEAILQQSQSQNHQLQNELKRFYSQLVQVQEESQHYQSQLVQVQEESQNYQSQLVQVQEESQNYQSQLVQVQEESQNYQSQLLQVQEESQNYQSQLVQVQEESQHYQSQLHRSQQELDRSHFQQYAVSERGVQSQMPYRLLVWDAWYAYQNGDVGKMQKCLQESLKCTPSSQTETIVNWLESFANFSLEKGWQLDTYSLTNSEEWKQLVRQAVAIKPTSYNGILAGQFS
jgi:FkbM family methyltransferase